MTEQWSPRAAVWPLAIAIAVKCSKQSLERSEAAIALLAGEVAIALVTRVAAIGRIADPFVDVNVATAAAATEAIANPRTEALAEDAAARTRTAIVGAGFTAVGAALVVAPVPDNRPGEAREAGLADVARAACDFSCKPLPDWMLR